MSEHPTCAYHSQVEAVDQCGVCQRDLCGLCQVLSLEGTRCRRCLAKEGVRRKIVWMVAAVGLLVIFGFAGAALLRYSRSTAVSSPKVAANTQASDDSPEAVLNLALKASEGCDHKTIGRLVDWQNRQRLYADSIVAARAFLKRCGESGVLQWRILDAQKHLGQWADAQKTASALIAKEPYDSDYWWWRGEVEDHLEQPVAALADYRQSLANSQSASGGRFAAGRVLDSAKDAGRPCEGLFALEFFAEYLGGQLRPQDEESILGVSRRAHCASSTDGTKYTLPKGTQTQGVEVTATMNGLKGRFLVSARAGTVVVTKDYALRAKLNAAPGSPAIETLAAGELQRGPVVVIPTVVVGAMTAKDVDALIAERLADGIDGTLGLSFLARFVLGEVDGRITLTRRL